MDIHSNSQQNGSTKGESRGRQCKHNHGHRKKVSVDDLLSAPSPIHEEIEVEEDLSSQKADVLKLDSRPLTASSWASDRKSRPGSSLSQCPPSRRPDSRPASSRSVFENIPGTRPASRRTISRQSNRSRRSRPHSSGSQALQRGHSSDSDSDNDEPRQRTTFEPDFNTVDIHDEKAFDTDLEVEDARERIVHLLPTDQTASYDHSGKTAYIDTCKKLGVVPASYFLRHLNDNHLNMGHHGLGANGMRALAESLSSNTKILELDLSDNWLGPKGGMAVCEMLRENCFITELDLSDNKLGNDCSPHLALIMTQNVTLTHIILSGNDFDDHSAPHFAEAILNTTKVQYLNLSHNNFGDVSGVILGPAIADNTCIKELDISWNCIRRKGAIAITQGIKIKCSVLTDNCFGGNEAQLRFCENSYRKGWNFLSESRIIFLHNKHISNKAYNNVFMKKINLSWNGFGLEGAVGLQDTLKGNSVLEELNISNNRITAEGAVVIGKGLSLNETLQTLKMGKNPMQSAGCYGICAAILRNPSCVLQHIDFSDILVNKDFEDVYHQVLEQLPNLKLAHGGMEPPDKPKAKVHPMVKLCNYIEKHELRLVDFFNKFDKDGSMSVTHEEFVEGIEETGIKLSSEEIELLLQELDRDGDGEINYNELVVSHVDFQEKREQINTVLTVMQPRPMTT